MRFFTFSIIALLVFACSTEKNTLVNRTYHGTTAHYNGYFNANELINTSMTSFLTSRKEDYYSLLPLNPLPNEEEVKGLYPSIDTAIVKCTKVISKHSMPTASEPSKKHAEHNAWIDENWLTIGISNYYRRDYEKAEKNFSYVNKFFSNDPSNYTASIWMAKTNIEMKNYGEASLILLELDKKIEELDAQNESKKGSKASKSKSKKSKSKSKKSKKSKKSEEEQEVAKFPKKSRYLFEITKAELAIIKQEKDKAIEYLESALKFCKKSNQKARIHYILAQLHAEKQENDKAKFHYGKVLKYNAPFEMNFNARINRAIMGGDEKIKRELEKMLRDEKNVEFKDQIYFALAEIAFKEGDQPKGIELMHKAILYSTANNRQKAICYEKLGDLSFSDRNYIKSQKYYDSCAQVLPDNYPNADGIRNKALKLKDLVTAVETAAFEDSVQRIAGMSQEDRYAFAEKVIKKMKEDEKRRKEQEAIRLKEIQNQQATANEPSGNKFFWNSPKLKSEGLESFRKQWGARENEDDWRRSDKIVMADFNTEEKDSINKQEASNPLDSLTPEMLLANLPINDSLVGVSTDRMLNAYYDAGIIYKDQLNETQMAVKQFESILDRKAQSNFNLLAIYQLYKIYEISDPVKSYAYKNQILVSYPDSDYANYLRDPDYFVKKKELEKLAEEDYVKILDRYKRELYHLVIPACNEVIDNEKQNPYRSKYMLLKAMSIGQSGNDKSTMIPILKQVISEYPGTLEEAKAKELIQIHEKGYSAYVETNFEHKSIFTYKESQDHYIIVFLDKKSVVNTAKTKIADFNKETFKNERFNVSSLVYGKDQNIVLVKEMDESKAASYVSSYKRSKKLGDMSDFKILSISQANLKLLIESQKLEEYELFYAEYY